MILLMYDVIKKTNKKPKKIAIEKIDINMFLKTDF